MLITFTNSLLPAFHEALGLLILLILFLHHTLNHVKLLLGVPRQSILLGGLGDVLLRWHVEDFEKVVNVEVVYVQRFQDYLADHEIDVLFLKVNLFKKLVKLLLGDGGFAVSFVSQSLQNVLLVLGDQLSDLDEHFLLFALIHQLVTAYELHEPLAY